MPMIKENFIRYDQLDITDKVHYSSPSRFVRLEKSRLSREQIIMIFVSFGLSPIRKVKEKKRDCMSFQTCNFVWYCRERCSLLEQKLLQEINCSVLQPSPTGSDDYFVERSIFFILGSLCSKRYNKSLCKTLFMSILSSYHSQNNKFDARHDLLRKGEKQKELTRMMVEVFFTRANFRY